MTDPDSEDSALLGLATAARAGDARAKDELLAAVISERLLQPPIRRYLFSADDVEQAEQLSLVAISFKLDQWSGESFSAWARQLAANEAKMIIRSRVRRQEYEDEASNSSQAFVARMSSHLATAADVERAMNALEEGQRSCLQLRAEGHSYPEISNMLGVPEGTVKTRVRLGRKHLSELLMRRGSTE